MTPPGTVLLHGNRASHLIRLFSESVRFLYHMKKFSIKFHFVLIHGKTHSQAPANRLFFRFRAFFTLPGVLGDWWQRDRPKETRHQAVKRTICK
jgi:hypothetical protein